MSEETTKRIGDYEILNELGAGGMGRVYRVRNVISDRIEAMKVLLPDLAGRQELAARFLREIKVLASLDHPNIAQFRTALTLDNQLVMIMEYVEGTSLATRLQSGPIPVPDALDYIDQVLSALSYAHQKGVIHRDIKPANMMLTPQGVVKVMDFGIARSGGDSNLTLTGSTLGSINFMSPEQVKGEPADARSDLYSTGVSLYEMVTGKRPFETGSDFAIMAAHVKEAPKPPVELQPGLPAALNEIILMAIEKDPAKRFQTAAAFRNALATVRGLSPTIQTTTRGAMVFDTSVQMAPVLSVPTPPPASRTPVSAPVRTLVDAKVTPTPVVQMPPPRARTNSHRGLYMALGALVVLAGLVVAGIYLPKKGNAGEKAAETTANPVPAPQPPQPAPVVETPPVEAPPPAKQPVVLAKQSAIAEESQAALDEAKQEEAKQLSKLGDEIDQMSARAAAVNQSLDHLKAQQAAAGYGLRGDIAARQDSMKINLSRAQDAEEKGDLVKAQKYVDKAEDDLRVLEQFLGR